MPRTAGEWAEGNAYTARAAFPHLVDGTDVPWPVSWLTGRTVTRRLPGPRCGPVTPFAGARDLPDHSGEGRVGLTPTSRTPRLQGLYTRDPGRTFVGVPDCAAHVLAVNAVVRTLIGGCGVPDGWGSDSSPWHRFRKSCRGESANGPRGPTSTKAPPPMAGTSNAGPRPGSTALSTSALEPALPTFRGPGGCWIGWAGPGRPLRPGRSNETKRRSPRGAPRCGQAPKENAERAGECTDPASRNQRRTKSAWWHGPRARGFCGVALMGRWAGQVPGEEFDYMVGDVDRGGIEGQCGASGSVDDLVEENRLARGFASVWDDARCLFLFLWCA